MKIIFGIILILGLGFIGLIIGTMIGGQFVPKGHGLAAAPTALVYGFVAAILGALGGCILLARLSASHLTRFSMVVLALTAIIIGLLVIRVKHIQKSQQQETRSPKPLQPTLPPQ